MPVERVSRATRLQLAVNAAAAMAIGLYAFIFPGIRVVRDLADPSLATAAMPQAALRLHASLTPRYEAWARERLRSGKAVHSTADISGTEWPLFGSVFYLAATEALQDDWQRRPGGAGPAPAAYARGAVEAAANLVLDPGQAAWVKVHWGEEYLTRENVFYRMLLINAAAAHARLTGEAKHLPLLRAQVDGLAAELERSPHGVLDDYPGQCYPADVVAAIAAIARADAVLGGDHRRFVDEAGQRFAGGLLDEHGLVPYLASSQSGRASGSARGCSSSYVSLAAPSLWPERAAAWYQLYERHFFQERWTAVGFREFPKEVPGYDWYFDVDAGPVIAGHGIAACAFGLGAARANGRFDHAYPLAAEMLAVSWPLPDGTLALPRLLSNAVDAPYLGEAAILYNLTRAPPAGVVSRPAAGLPLFAYLMTACYFVLGLALLASAWLSARSRSRELAGAAMPLPRLQGSIWLALAVGAAAAFAARALLVAMVLVVLMGRLPHGRGRSQARPAR